MSQKEFISRLFKKGEAKKKRPRSKKVAQAHKKASASDILEFIKSSSGFLSNILKSFLKHSKIKVSEIDIVVATEDASKTAIMYGIISQAAAYLLQILGNFTTLKKSYRGTARIMPDFTRETSSVKLDIQLQCRPLRFLLLLFSALTKAKRPQASQVKAKKHIKPERRNKKCRKTN